MREGWEKTQLGNVTQQVIDPVELDPDRTYINLGVKWYAAGTFLREPKAGAEIKATRLFRVRPGQFVYNRLFATEGSFALVRSTDEHAVASNEFPVFSVDTSRLMPEYLYLHFQQPSVWQEVNRQCTGTTKSRLRWKEDRFAAYGFGLPPLPEQRRIVDLIGALDDTLVASGATLLASPYSQLLRVLGEHYEAVAIEGVVDRAFAGGTPSRQVPSHFNGGIPWLKSGEVECDHIVDSTEHITDEAMRSSSARLVPSGSTVVAMYGQGDTKGRAGFVASPVTTNQAVLALVPNLDRIDPRFLLHAVRSRTGSLRSRAVGAAQPNLSKALVLAETVPLPLEVREQREWADLLDAVRRVESDAQVEHVRLQAARSSLLTALLSGEHAIPESYDELIGEAS